MKNYILPVPFLIALALSSACERQEGRAAIYAPNIVGTTLQFEASEPENGTRPKDRLQLSVESAKPVDGGLEVVCTISTLQGTARATFLCQEDGGVVNVMADGSKSVQLPPGFPSKTASWQANRVNFQVLGRAKANLAGIELSDPIGVWVEAKAASPQPLSHWRGRARMLILPGIGEAETKVLHEGNWVTVNRLVGLGASSEPL